MAKDDEFDAVASAKAAAEGIAKAGAGAPAVWKDSAEAWVRWVANTHPQFTTDDVWQEMKKAGVLRPPDSRAMGAVISRLAANAFIENTGKWIKTIQKSRHRAPVTVWRKK